MRGPAAAPPGGSPGASRRAVTLVLCHGSQHRASYWTALRGALAERGYPHATAVEFRASRWATLPALVAELRHHLDDDLEDAKNVVLVGHSQGALVVQSHVATGGAARAAILLAPVPCDRWLLARHATRLAARVSWTGLFKAALTANAAHVMAPDVATMRRNFFLPTTERTTLGGSTMAEYFEKHVTDEDTAFGALAVRGNARDVRVPALVVAAAQDRLVDVDTVRALHGLLPHAVGDDATVVPNQAHAFGDPGWETSLVDPVVRFLDEVVQQQGDEELR